MASNGTLLVSDDEAGVGCRIGFRAEAGRGR
jgi:hypothetical protein